MATQEAAGGMVQEPEMGLEREPEMAQHLGQEVVPAERVLLSPMSRWEMSVAGRGALKNGMFVPTELGVMDAAAMGQRRRRGADGSGAGAPGTAAPSGTAAPKVRQPQRPLQPRPESHSSDYSRVIFRLSEASQGAGIDSMDGDKPGDGWDRLGSGTTCGTTGGADSSASHHYARSS